MAELNNSKKDSGSGVFTSMPAVEGVENRRAYLLDSIKSDGNLPAIGSAVSKVIQMTSDGDEAVRDLAYFILSDVALTQKVLRVANAVCYRTSSGSSVTTVSKAIFMLGFDTVKTTALAMLLVDSMAGKRGKNVRAELAHALTSSVIGRELARRSPFRDAEEAAIAALFRNIGRLLVAAHDHVSYAEITAMIDSGTSPAVAAMRVLGCTFEMLATEMLQEWNIPDSIIKALEPLPAGVLKPAKTRHEWMQQVTSFSATAANLIAHVDVQGNDAASRALLSRFGEAFALDQSKLAEFFNVVRNEMQALSNGVEWSAQSDSPSDEAQAQKVVIEEAQIADDESDDAADYGLPDELRLVAVNAVSVQPEMRHASGKPVNARDLLLAGVQDVTEMMASGRCKTNDLIMLVLETLYRSLGFRFATICLKDIKADQFRARISLGESHAERQASFTFPAASSRNLFHLAMENDADLLISDATDLKIRDLIPAWHRALLPDARSFIVLPLVIQKKPFGFFYADRTLPAVEGVPSDETSLIKTLKGQVLTALNTR